MEKVETVKNTVADRVFVFLRAFANGSELHKKLGDRLVLNAYRFELFSGTKT